VPVPKKRKRHAEEEEEDASDIDYVTETEEEEETGTEGEEEEEVEEGVIVSGNEEELPATSQTLKDVANSKKKKTQNPRKKDEKRKDKKPKTTSTEPNSSKRVVKKKKMATTEQSDDDDGKKKIKPVVYNDKNVDYNLYNEAPEHIKNLKIKLSSNTVMLSRMIEAPTGGNAHGLMNDYAALSFLRQNKNGKAYEFNMPLTLAPNVLKGIQLLIKGNPTFFDRSLSTLVKSSIQEKTTSDD
jgi:hypothetical protein